MLFIVCLLSFVFCIFCIDRCINVAEAGGEETKSEVELLYGLTQRPHVCVCVKWCLCAIAVTIEEY